MGCSKAVLRSKFISIQFYLKKQEKSQINNLILHLSKNKQNSKLVEGKKSQKSAEVNERGTKEKPAKINKSKSWFF